MSEQVLLQEGEVRVTDAELRVAGERYPLSEIHSVRSVREPAAASGPSIMIVAGAICVFSAFGDAGLWGALIGAALIAAAVVWWTQKKPSFQVRLETPDGETTPFESRDEEVTHRVVEALQRALSSSRATDRAAPGAVE